MGLKESRLYRWVPLVFALGAVFATGSAQAAKWERDIVVAPSLIYTDNVCLTKDDKRSDWTGVALLTPSGTVSVETSRTQARLSGSVTINTLSAVIPEVAVRQGTSFSPASVNSASRCPMT